MKTTKEWELVNYSFTNECRKITNGYIKGFNISSAKYSKIIKRFRNEGISIVGYYDYSYEYKKYAYKFEYSEENIENAKNLLNRLEEDSIEYELLSEFLENKYFVPFYSNELDAKSITALVSGLNKKYGIQFNKEWIEDENSRYMEYSLKFDNENIEKVHQFLEKFYDKENTIKWAS